MTTRPIVLQGSEQVLFGACRSEGQGLWFDGASGVWRDPQGGLAVRSAYPPQTRITATREGTDQNETSSALSTTITKTREGADQADCAAAF